MLQIPDTTLPSKFSAVGSAALMLEHLGLPGEAARLHAAIEVVTAAGVLTRDLGGTATTQDVTKALIDARAAFDLRREPEHVRERYWRYSWGQTVLLARRLIEAGVRLVHVNWIREPGDTAVDNPLWDTHAQNADRLQDALCPQFDVTFTALLEDLHQRGLLETTIVTALGEMGRNKIYKDPAYSGPPGRDHWGAVQTVFFAGGGCQGGRVVGSSDRIGGHPQTDPQTPENLAATMYEALGIARDATWTDVDGRPHKLYHATPIEGLMS